MELTVVGSSPAVQNPGGACSSYLITHGGQQLLVDCGHGSVGVLRSVTELGKLSAVIISHMHPDHYFDLLPLAYGFKFGNLPPVPLLLPPGGHAVLTAYQDAAGLDEGFIEGLFEVDTYDPAERLHLAGFDIDFVQTRHFIDCWAMRYCVPGDDRTIAYSADTGWTDEVLDLFRGASLALIEAALLEYPTGQAKGGHLTAELAGELARKAGARHLVVTHYAHGDAEDTLREAACAFGGPTDLAHERDIFRP